MKKLLWIGDAGCPSGFARATHNTLATLCREYDVTVLGINYRGDPHDYPYPIYAAAASNDSIGASRLLWMCNRIKPDIIVIQQDAWFIPIYMRELRRKFTSGEYCYPEYAAIPVVAALAVDGKNFRGEWLDGIELAVFWTQFGLDEAREGGYRGDAVVIPLGVDTGVYYPVDRDAALERLGVGVLKGKFIVGNVNRNQPRKRWDLTLKFFAEWVGTRGIPNAQLFMHAAPTGDDGIDVMQMARYYGITDMLAVRTPETFYGVTEAVMRDTYNCFDVDVSTTQGEGFGLTTLEAMACGVPCIVPAWSALGEWAKGAASLVPCISTALNPVVPGLNVIGGVPDKKAFVAALDTLYADAQHRSEVGRLGLQRASEERFRWANIGAAWAGALAAVFAPRAPEVWQDLSASGEVWEDLGQPEEVRQA